jgi:hypothetical protein
MKKDLLITPMTHERFNFTCLFESRCLSDLLEETFYDDRFLEHQIPLGPCFAGVVEQVGVYLAYFSIALCI